MEGGREPAGASGIYDRLAEGFLMVFSGFRSYGCIDPDFERF